MPTATIEYTDVDTITEEDLEPLVMSWTTPTNGTYKLSNSGYVLGTFTYVGTPRPATPTPGPDTVPTPQDITDALTRLGTAADEIAASLHEAGIKGVRGNGWLCPLAVYLNRTFPGVSIGVSGSYVTVLGEHTRVPMPSGHVDFVRRFDFDPSFAGGYPYLVNS